MPNEIIPWSQQGQDLDLQGLRFGSGGKAGRLDKKSFTQKRKATTVPLKPVNRNTRRAIAAGVNKNAT